MANEIDLVVGSVAFKQITDLLVELGKVDGEIKKIGESAIKMNTALGVKNTADLTKLSAENAKLNKEIEKLIGSAAVLETKLANLATAQARTAKATTDAAIAEEKLITATNKNTIAVEKKTKATLEETIAQREATNAKTLEIKAGQGLAQTYAELDARHKQAVKLAQDLAVSTGRTGQAYEDAKLKANDYGKQLRVIDTDIGKHTRNVGNYSSSWNGLGNSINQLTREAPAFANSVQTGFMALSNNIPILTDELGVLIQKNKDLQAEGKPTQSILKTVAGAFFSWQTAISLGVTILTVYGAKLYELATAGTAAQKSQKALGDAMAEGTKNANEEVYKLDVLYRTSQNVTLSIEQRTKAVDQLQKQYPSYFGNLKDEDILIGSAKKSYDELKEAIIASSRAKAISSAMDKLAAEEFAKEMDIRVKIEEKMLEAGERRKTLSEVEKIGSPAQIARAKALYQSSLNDITEYNKKVGALQNDLVKQSDIFLKARTANEDKAAKLEADRAGKGLGKPKADKSAEDAAKKEEEIAKKHYETLLSDAERQKEIDKDILESFRGGIVEKTMLSAKFAADEVAIANLVFEEKKRLAKGDVELIKQATNEKKTAVENAGQEDIKRVSSFYSKYFKEVEKSIPKEIDSKIPGMFTKEQMKEAEDADKERKAKLKASLEEQASYLQSFGNEFAAKSGFPETFKMLSGQIEGFGENAGVTFNAIAESAQEMFNMIGESSQASFDAEYARLDAQKNEALKNAGDSTAAKEKIEADYEKKKKEIQLREFKQKQKMSLANIAIDTAQAIVSIWAQVPKVDFGVSATALSIMVGALGAVQAGMVLAQKPPAYADGTDNHSGGLMLVNDGAGSNFQEKVILPSGKVIRPQGRNVLMDAPKGTKVLNHEQQLFEMLQSNNISMSSPQYQGMTPDEMDEILGKHFGNIKTQNTIFDKNGFQTYVRNGNSITRSNSNRSQAIGISV